MNHKLLKRCVLITSMFSVSNIVFAHANGEISTEEQNQINIDKIRASSGIDYILLPSGEKINSDSTSYTVYQNGTYIFSVFDRAGNSEIIEVEVSNIDMTIPTINLNRVEEDGITKIQVQGSDLESGVSHIIMPNGERIEGSNGEFTIPKTGKYNFEVHDLAGNVAKETLDIADSGVAEALVEKAEATQSPIDIENAREAVNALPEGPKKESLHERLDAIIESALQPLDRLNATSNLDIYIKSQNMISLSLNTSSITFEDFDGVDDIDKANAIELSVNSSLPYDINVYLPNEIENTTKDSIMDIRTIEIKESTNPTYSTFTGVNIKLPLKEDNIAGNNKIHNIDIRLKGGYAYKKDIYKATLKFEIKQR